MEVHWSRDSKASEAFHQMCPWALLHCSHLLFLTLCILGIHFLLLLLRTLILGPWGSQESVRSWLSPACVLNPYCRFVNSRGASNQNTQRVQSASLLPCVLAVVWVLICILPGSLSEFPEVQSLWKWHVAGSVLGFRNNMLVSGGYGINWSWQQYWWW